jgi:hypothetical protein
MILYYKVIAPDVIYSYPMTRKLVLQEKKGKKLSCDMKNYFEARKLPFDSSLRIRLREVSVMPR